MPHLSHTDKFLLRIINRGIFFEVFYLGRVSSFKRVEVVNLYDGRRLGFVSDADVNFETGRLEAIMVAGAGKLFGASSKDSELIIPFEKIKKIGDDVIIVEIEERILKFLFK